MDLPRSAAVDDKQVLRALDPEVLEIWQTKINEVQAIWDKYTKAAPQMVKEFRSKGKYRADRKKFIQSFVQFLASDKHPSGADKTPPPQLDAQFALKLFTLDHDFIDDLKTFCKRHKANLAALDVSEMEEVLRLVEVEKVMKS